MKWWYYGLELIPLGRSSDLHWLIFCRKTRTCIHTPGDPPMLPTDLSQSSMLSALDRASIVYFDVRLHETALMIAKEVSIHLFTFKSVLGFISFLISPKYTKTRGFLFLIISSHAKNRWVFMFEDFTSFSFFFKQKHLPHNLHVHFLLCLLRLSRAGRSQEYTNFSWCWKEKRWIRWSLAICRLRCLLSKIPSGKLVLVFPASFLSIWGQTFSVSRVLQTWTEVSSTPGALVSMLLRLPKLKFVIVTLGEEGCLMLQRASQGRKTRDFVSLARNKKFLHDPFLGSWNILWLCRFQQKYWNLKRQTSRACWRH